MRSVLVTGGAGYIGSHTVLSLLESGYEVVVLDSLCNSSCESLERVAHIAKRTPRFVRGDIRDRSLLDRLFAHNNFDAVLHFAGLKAVGESVAEPLNYYDNNVYGSQVLLQACAKARVFKLVFSSSATVYGEPAVVPVTEASYAANPSNPYGRSKLMVEQMLHDLVMSESSWRVAIMRYFNPVGAHCSGLIGEDPKGVPNNLLPYIAQVAVGKLPELAVFGNDYDTPDGTGVRDYIHVVDLAEGHLCALNALRTVSGFNVWNLGTGKGHSVMEVLRAFEAVTGKQVAYRLAPRRAGDIAVCFADPGKAMAELGWKAQYGLDDMLRDAWRWQSMNPNGYS